MSRKRHRYHHRNRGRRVDGLLFINKPAGITSHDVVDRIRDILGFRKIGHLGTLDPMAEGLLPMALGSATRLSSILTLHDKVYRAALKLGVQTDTHDRMGHVTQESPVPPDLDVADLQRALEPFQGEICQVPPLISAKKYKGKPLYYWVRIGQSIPPPEPRKVTFYSIDVLAYERPIVQLSVHCSAGAYIRGLARDLGKAVGCGAIVDHIERILWGRYTLEESITLAGFEAEPVLQPPYYVPMVEIEPQWPSLHAAPETITRLLQGRPVVLHALLRSITPPEQVIRQPYLKVLSPTNDLVSIARIEYPERIVPAINFPQFWNPRETTAHEKT